MGKRQCTDVTGWNAIPLHDSYKPETTSRFQMANMARLVAQFALYKGEIIGFKS